MKLNKLATILAEYSYNLGLDLQKYVEVQTGKGYFKDAQYQQVQLPDAGNSSNSDNEQSQQDTVKTEGQDQQYDDFHMEIDEPCGGSGSSIKTYQFNSGFIAPSKPIGNPIEQPPQLCLKIHQHFGHNSKQKQSCILLSPKHYIISIGCTILLVPVQKNKQNRLYQQHVYEITTLYYSRQHKILLTGSKGIKPEIVIWRVEEAQKQKQKGSGQIQIKFVNKFYMERKVEGVGLIRMLNKDVILVVDCLSIHCGNQIRAYDIEAGVKLSFHKKLTQKIMDMQVDKKQAIYLGTNKGILKISNPMSNPLLQTISTIPNIMSIQITQNLLIVGTQKQTIYILSMQGKEIQKIQIHQGFVFNIDVIPIISNVNGKKINKYLLVSCGTKDNCVRVSIVDELEEATKVKVADFATVDMKSYCTAISSVDDQNVLLGWRDGSIVIFDAKNKVKKYEKLSTISCVKSSSVCFTNYNALTQKIAFNYKNQIFNLNPSKMQILSSSKSNMIKKTPSITLLPIKQIKNLNCFWINKEKMAQIYISNKKKYLLEIIDLTQNNKNQDEPVFSIQLNLQKQGKPRLVRFNQDFVAVGTKYGYIVVVIIKSGVTVISSEKHDESVEDIVFQQGKFKEKQSFYLKTVSGSQLLHWQLKLDSEVPTIAPIKKTTQIKNLQWTSLCKYCWETKNIWQEMTHYQDIESVALVGSKVKNICVSMATGVLRVYRFPATRNNYIELKLFPSKFRLFTCGKQNQMLLCQYNLQFLLIQLNDKEEEK